MNLVEFIEALGRAADKIDEIGKIKIMSLSEDVLLNDPIGYWYYLEEKTEEEYKAWLADEAKITPPEADYVDDFYNGSHLNLSTNTKWHKSMANKINILLLLLLERLLTKE